MRATEHEPAFLAYIKRVEGGEEHRDDETGHWFSYCAPEGNETIGYGHVVLPHERDVSWLWVTGLSDLQVETLLKQDLTIARFGAKDAAGASHWGELSALQQQMLIDFSFNLGPGFYKTFPKFLRCVLEGDIEGALKESKRFYFDPRSRAFKELKHRNRCFEEFVRAALAAKEAS